FDRGRLWRRCDSVQRADPAREDPSCTAGPSRRFDWALECHCLGSTTLPRTIRRAIHRGAYCLYAATVSESRFDPTRSIASTIDAPKDSNPVVLGPLFRVRSASLARVSLTMALRPPPGSQMRNIPRYTASGTTPGGTLSVTAGTRDHRLIRGATRR